MGRCSIPRDRSSASSRVTPSPRGLPATRAWEPADQNLLHYRFKFDFSRNTIPARVEDSKLSPGYTLEIVDKPAEAK